MENIDNNILQELEKADEYKEQIEREINNILKESDCVLVKAESQLNIINNNDTYIKIEKDIENSSESSFALSIEVSRDLFKEFDNEHNISEIFPPSVEFSSTKLIDDVIVENSRDYEEHSQEREEHGANSQEREEHEANSQERDANSLEREEHEANSQEHEVNKVIEEKEDFTNENNETMGPSLEITITNDPEDDIEQNMLEKTLLNNSSTFMGCSKEFASNGVEGKISVVIDVNKGRSVSTSPNNKLEENPIQIAEVLKENPIQIAEVLKENNPPNKVVEYQEKNTIKVDINSNSESGSIFPNSQKISLKRPINEINPPEVAKKLKFDLPKLHEANLECDQTQTEYSHVIFDPDETADANDPKWSELNNNSSIEEHFNSVRKQWRSMALPNPHKNLTMRFVPEHYKYKSETPANPENEYASMPCVQYLDNKINRYTQKVNALYVKLKYLPQSNRGRSQRNKILQEIDELQKFVIEIVKNREEIQQNFMFYQHPNNAWNANYLTRNELDELKEQEKLLEFQKRFYSR